MDRLRQSLSTRAGRAGVALNALILGANLWALATGRVGPLSVAAVALLPLALVLMWSAQYRYERRHWLGGAAFALSFWPGVLSPAGSWGLVSIALLAIAGGAFVLRLPERRA